MCIDDSEVEVEYRSELDGQHVEHTRLDKDVFCENNLDVLQSSFFIKACPFQPQS
jgi:hypothetical protein